MPQHWRAYKHAYRSLPRLGRGNFTHLHYDKR